MDRVKRYTNVKYRNIYVFIVPEKNFWFISSFKFIEGHKSNYFNFYDNPVCQERAMDIAIQRRVIISLI